MYSICGGSSGNRSAGVQGGLMSDQTSEVLNIKTGDKMPAFTMPVHTGGEVSLKQFKGSSAVVLFYYPKANTSG